MNYIGIDGNVHSDELKHWKYIKKVKSGSGWRYFYTPEEVRAFYKESKQENAQTHQKNLKNISDSYNRSMDQAKNRTMTFDYKNNKWRNLNKKEVESHRKNYAEPERKSSLRKEAVRNKFGTSVNLSKKLTKEPRKDINKTQKRIQAEAQGVKRAVKSMTSQKGYATPDHTLVKKQTLYSKNADTYKTKTTKSSDWGLGPDRVSYSKSKKTRSVEKLFVKSHRAIINSDKKAKNKVTKGKAKVEKIIKSEAAGTKRVLNATRGKGNNFYSGDGKTYSKYNKKKQRLGKKKYKTSKMERAILKGYRATHPYE